MATAIKHGWVVLPCGAEVLLENGIPRRAWIKEYAMSETPDIVAETVDVTGFHVTIGEWELGENTGEMEAVLIVTPHELGDVLQCLAAASAGVFYDRYKKAIEPDDTDWDDEAYAQDFNTALQYCGVTWGEVNEQAYRQIYCEAMHRRTEELAREV